MNESSDKYKYDGDGLVPIDGEEDDIGRLLRKYSVKGIDGQFWTDKLLRHILKRERITAELQRPKYNFNQSQVDSYVDKIHPRGIAHSADRSPPGIFLKVFALLVLKDRCGDIGDFVKAGCNDEKLPIRIENNNDTVYSLNQPDGEPLRKFRLQKGTQRPWRRSPKERSGPLIEHSDNAGAFGTVTRVDIHPTSHSYQQLLTGINLDCTKFAIKTLHISGRDIDSKFNEGWEMLKRFSGRTHPHLVTVLCAFSCEEERSFIFPNASYDLSEYLEKHEPPTQKNGTLWISNQFLGLMGALDTIHNPKHLHQGVTQRYGRHGDIKCDNILCFKRSGTQNDVVLVISDFGLSAFNTDKSRSNIPNKNVPPVPGYRPPECDIEGGTISRAFDVWTIGCLYLELITWFLGGSDYVEEFSNKRTTIFINGSNNNIFFTLKSGKEPGTYVAQVKPEVTEWILQLHQHPKCSEFIHDALDVVEQEMLAVLSADMKRSSSEKLLKEYEKLSQKCKSTPGFTERRPWGFEKLEVARKRMSELNMAVDAVPNKNAEALIRKFSSQLQVHEGETKKPLRTEDWETIDN
ncbi:kinase-like domain-containing protein [Fusarium sp. MPI-SDFR-AT-0072]|nr:kinase-like domain-containing protein [Fusarium sp. MPI-SDFR-AT-0072]